MSDITRIDQNARRSCRFLLDRHDVPVVPGGCFGLAPYARLSYATSEQNLREAVKRIARACRELS
jgi:aspartate aminotransferase